MNQLVPVLALLIFVIIFGAALLVLTNLSGVRAKKSPTKGMPYESGVVGVETYSSRMSVRFYLTAILFIIFDIEIVFIYPWAMTFKESLPQFGTFMFFEMIAFMATLAWGLFYIWRGGALDWE